MSDTPAPAVFKPAPGIYTDLPNEVYHGSEGISKSGIDLVQQSPLHYWDRYLNPEKEPEEDKDHFVVGSALHTAASEPDLFGARYLIAPSDINKRTKEGKAQWAALELEAKTTNKSILKASDRDDVLRMASVLRKHPSVSKLLQGGVVEQSMYFTDPTTGVLRKMRPDYWRHGMLVDLKTTTDASLEAFRKAIYNWGYHRQAAWYLDGNQIVTAEDHQNFVFVVIEKERPFGVGVYVLDDESITRGRIECRDALDTYKRCLDTGEWPGYPSQVQTISLPLWAFKAAA